MAEATDDAGLPLFKSMRFIYFPNHSRLDEVTQGSIAFQPPRGAKRCRRHGRDTWVLSRT